MPLSTAQLRRHAALLRERYSSPDYGGRSEDVASALAQADQILAQAELEDAKAGRAPEVADSCQMVEEYPLLGKITREGGRIQEVEHPWETAEINRVEAAGIAVAWEWCHDPAAGLRQGELIRIYVGTRADGPRVMWSRHNREWYRVRSNGNYGRNWSHGGTWSSDKITYPTLALAAPDIAAIVEDSNG